MQYKLNASETNSLKQSNLTSKSSKLTKSLIPKIKKQSMEDFLNIFLDVMIKASNTQTINELKDIIPQKIFDKLPKNNKENLPNIKPKTKFKTFLNDLGGKADNLKEKKENLVAKYKTHCDLLNTITVERKHINDIPTMKLKTLLNQINQQQYGYLLIPLLNKVYDEQILPDSDDYINPNEYYKIFSKLNKEEQDLFIDIIPDQVKKNLEMSMAKSQLKKSQQENQRLGIIPKGTINNIRQIKMVTKSNADPNQILKHCKLKNANVFQQISYVTTSNANPNNINKVTDSNANPNNINMVTTSKAQSQQLMNIQSKNTNKPGQITQHCKNTNFNLTQITQNPPSTNNDKPCDVKFASNTSHISEKPEIIPQPLQNTSSKSSVFSVVGSVDSAKNLSVKASPTNIESYDQLFNQQSNHQSKQTLSNVDNQKFENQVSNTEQQQNNSQVLNTEQQQNNSQVLNTEQQQNNSQVLNTEQQQNNSQVLNTEQQQNNSQVLNTEQQQNNSQVSNTGQQQNNSQVLNTEQQQNNSQVLNTEQQQNSEKDQRVNNSLSHSQSNIDQQEDNQYITPQPKCFFNINNNKNSQISMENNHNNQQNELKDNKQNELEKNELIETLKNEITQNQKNLIELTTKHNETTKTLEQLQQNYEKEKKLHTITKEQLKEQTKNEQEKLDNLHETHEQDLNTHINNTKQLQQEKENIEKQVQILTDNLNEKKQEIQEIQKLKKQQTLHNEEFTYLVPKEEIVEDQHVVKKRIPTELNIPKTEIIINQPSAETYRPRSDSSPVYHTTRNVHHFNQGTPVVKKIKEPKNQNSSFGAGGAAGIAAAAYLLTANNKNGDY